MVLISLKFSSQEWKSLQENFSRQMLFLKHKEPRSIFLHRFVHDIKGMLKIFFKKSLQHFYIQNLYSQSGNKTFATRLTIFTLKVFFKIELKNSQVAKR